MCKRRVFAQTEVPQEWKVAETLNVTRIFTNIIEWYILEFCPDPL